MRVQLVLLALLVTPASGTGCRLQQSFRCEVDDHCAVAEAGKGVCEPSGYCSFNDPDCDSGRRYGGFAPDELADVCVAVAGSSGGGLSAATADASATTAAATATAPSDDDSTGTSPVEICDGLDNDADGYIDEFSPRNTSCEGCELTEVQGRPLWVCMTPFLSWDDAIGFCDDRFAAPLVALDTDAMREAGLALAAELERQTERPGYWIGGRLAQGRWSWTDGREIDALDWAENQPQGGEGEDCLIAGPTGWRDGFCATDSLPALCGAP